MKSTNYFLIFEVNSTGFLVQNYENLFDTNINAFFDALKIQIKSISIQSHDVISFLGGLLNYLLSVRNSSID